MSFVHPLFLLGLGSLALPLLLHLLKRRKVQRVDFPTLRFFHSIRRRSSLLLRVGNLLLLLLRLGALVAVTLLFAQPFFRDPSLRHWNSGPRTTVVLWDDSRSTAAQLGDGRPVHAWLREALGREFAGASRRERVEVIALAPRARQVFAGAAHELDPAALPAPCGARADWKGGAEMARRLFTDRGVNDRTLLLASDMPSTEVTREVAERLPPAVLRLLHPPDPPTRNDALVAVVEQGATAIEGAPYRVQAEVARFGAGARPARLVELVRLGEGGTPTRLAAAELPDQARATVNFDVRLGGRGLAQLAVRLQGAADALPADDQVPLAVQVGGARRILALDGEPNPAPLYDELFYLQKAAGAAGLEVDALSEAAPLEFRDPAGYGAVHLANWADPEAVRPFLRRHLDAGGTAVLWLGDQLDAEAWNRGLLAELGHLTLRGRASHEKPRSWRYAASSTLPPRLAALAAAKYWIGVQASSYWFLEHGPGFDPRSVLAEQRDRTPALVVARAGRGHVVYVNAGADVEDGDLPTHPVFPSLVLRTAALGDERLDTYAAGDEVRVPLEEGATLDLEVLTPSGARVPLRPELVGEALVARFTDTREPGIYRLIQGGGEGQRETLVQVRADSAESDLAPASAQDLARLFPGASEGQAAAPQGGLRLRELLALLLAVFLVLEAALVGHLEAAPPAQP